MTTQEIRERYKAETKKEAIVNAEMTWGYENWLESEHARLTAELEALRGRGEIVELLNFIYGWIDDWSLSEGQAFSILSALRTAITHWREQHIPLPPIPGSGEKEEGK